MKQQCLMCGRKTSVKDWRCECSNLWHACRMHRYAKTRDLPLPKQSNAMKGRSSPVENPEENRAKVIKTSSDPGRNDTDELSAGNRKRKRNINECERPMDDADDPPDTKCNLKRKRNPDDLIDLGNIVHDNSNLNFLSPALKRRIYGNALMG